jgi:hypothetical protein
MNQTNKHTIRNLTCCTRADPDCSATAADCGADISTCTHFSTQQSGQTTSPSQHALKAKHTHSSHAQSEISPAAHEQIPNVLQQQQSAAQTLAPARISARNIAGKQHRHLSMREDSSTSTIRNLTCCAAADPEGSVRGVTEARPDDSVTGVKALSGDS